MMKILTIIWCLLLAIMSRAQTGPGGIGSTDGSSPLKVWLDASNGVYKDSSDRLKAGNAERVRLWTDLSGSKNHVRARTDSTRPSLVVSSPLFNSQNAIRFYRNNESGNKRNYLESDTFAKTSDISIYCVFNALSKGGGNNVTPVKSKATMDSMWYNGSGLVDADVFSPSNDVSMTLCDTSLAAGGGDSISKTDHTVKTPVSLRKTYFGALKKEMLSGTLSISQNGSNPVSLVAGKHPVYNSKKYTIGATSNSVNGIEKNYLDGYISEVIVINKYLSNAETVILENYLAARYAIALENNDLFKMDEAAFGNYDYDLAGIGNGQDNKPHVRSRGQGIVEISNPDDLNKGEFLLWAHNGSGVNYQTQDVPEGVQQRLMRTWRANETGETGKLDLLIDTRSFPGADTEDLVLMVDTDNNGSFENEILGTGLFTQAKYVGSGQYLFSQININNENRFTFGTLKAVCQVECEAVFTPNGDGIQDIYFLDSKGKAQILSKQGELIREMNTPGYWDGTKSNGGIANEGLYFIISNDTDQRTVTLLK